MNRARRRHGKARRHKARVIREMRAWTKCDWERLPRGGRLRLPALRLAAAITYGMARLLNLGEPVEIYALHMGLDWGPISKATREHMARTAGQVSGGRSDG